MFKKLKFLLFVFGCIFIIGCQKKDNVNEIDYKFTESEFNVSNITQNSFDIEYKINTNGLKVTKLLVSKDSSGLIFHTTFTSVDPTFDKSDSVYKCSAVGLDLDTKYWFQILFKDVRDSLKYSKIYNSRTKGFNLRWVTPPPRVFKGEEMNFCGDNVDTIRSNYQISLDDNIWHLKSISLKPDKSYWYTLIIPDVSFGKHSFTVKYKGRLIFSDTVEAFKGGLLSLGSRLGLGGFSNNFIYNNEIYVYFDITKFWKFNPVSNIWTQLSTPNIVLNLPEYKKGFELNGKIFFPPFTCSEMTALYCRKSPDDEKYIYSYDPVLSVWEKHALLNNDSVPVYSGLYSSFVFNNKLYCFVMHNNATNYSACLLKVFDPIDYSWKTVIDSVPIPDILGCESIVLDNKIYIIVASLSYEEQATKYYKNDLYLCDLVSKTFTKKAIWDFSSVGSLCGYLFDYEGHLYYYGGEFCTGYKPANSAYAFEYDPTMDKWTDLASCFFSFDTGSTFGGFLYDIKDRIFLGFGQSDRIFEFIMK